MGKLHELLAVEKTKVNAANKLLADMSNKFGKFDYFQGFFKTLKMIEDSPQNAAIEAASEEVRQLPTTVHETLEYALKYWADAEDVVFQKNKTNQYAQANILFRGTVVAENVPVDELMGLESRLETLRRTLESMPTLTASVLWNKDAQSGRKGAWIVQGPEITTKTEKVTTPVVLYAATDKHPAQVKEITVDKTIGTFKLIKTCGAATSAQKAEVLSVIDDLITEIKQARMRANSVDAAKDSIGKRITDIIMSAFSDN
jgi:hypothetical protein